VVFGNVLLHLWGLFPASSTRPTAGPDRWKDAVRRGVSGNFVGDGFGHEHSEPDAFLSLVLPAKVNRWVNIVFGAIYTAIMILAIRGGWHFYVVFGLIEIILTSLIVRYAWT
jgi:hypothetical protein